ncbi:MAG: radical SAM protein [Candidatus Omnitrophica bacterium]|nr:radical SAM protein [Candidatus Omnitrophota bacterium]MDE2008570.1 radical SAM protein [Candidatus Omnitrophota bacterium]MDE2214036.1 radical SAM protein [Candidatus Omnitrophota bacterium]MDE2230986.1 radical SAM protein [Candidatus Omnitrophota bacterium]
MEKSGTLSTPEQKHSKFKVHYTWIYVTERCNLHCDYCFFRHMHGREISLDAVEKLFLLFEKETGAPSTLIFSGGEAFLAKENLFRILNEAHGRFKDTSLHIQTNGLLIDRDSIIELRRLGVTLEFGIDGASEATLRHRCGLKPASFKKLTETIRACVQAGIGCGSTMTVHPQEVDHMEQGLDFLREMGIPHVDVTPAAFMPWTPETVALFKTNYLKLARRPELRRTMYANEDNEWIAPGYMDLSLHPPGYLLGGDPFLCLPENKRMEFNIWDDVGRFRPEVLAFYRTAHEKVHREHAKLPYREFVCHNFELMNSMMGTQYMNTWAINDILRFLTRTHLTLGVKKYGT